MAMYGIKANLSEDTMLNSNTNAQKSTYQRNKQQGKFKPYITPFCDVVYLYIPRFAKGLSKKLVHQ